MNELVAVGIIVVAALLLRGIVRSVMERFAIRPAEDELRSGGIQDVLARLRDRRSGR